MVNILYHGTCRAFAEQWQTAEGRTRLEQYFGRLPVEYAEPVILEFDRTSLGTLGRRLDGDVEEFFVERGPVRLPSYDVTKSNGGKK